MNNNIFNDKYFLDNYNKIVDLELEKLDNDYLNTNSKNMKNNEEINTNNYEIWDSEESDDN